MDICKHCCEKMMCDQVKYDCPLKSNRGIPYRIQDHDGEEATFHFRSFEDVCDFCDRTLLFCVGRADV